MKKTLILSFFLFLTFNIYAAPKQSSQIIQSGHWIYDDLTVLTSEAKTTMYLETQPLSVGEINFFLNKINYDNLSSSSKIIYEKIQNFLNEEDDFFKDDDGFRCFLNLRANPELFYKSNEEIPWSFYQNFKDSVLTFPIVIGFSDFITIQSDLNISINHYYAQKPNNFTNIPFGVHKADFSFPNFAYFSSCKTFDSWGISAHMGKEGKKIGNTSLGSIIYNDTFDTDFYMQLNLFSNYLKYSMDVAQISVNKFLYLHQITLRPFKNFNLSVIEGSMLNSSFELRYLNPLMIMHEFGSWVEYDIEKIKYYGESNFCAYLCFTLDYIPIKNLRIYALYAQNEITDFGGSMSKESLSMPDSIGAQLGVEYFIPLQNQSHLKTGIEAVWTSPYLYVKHTPDTSLYRVRRDMQAPGLLHSWIGSPFGPDCFAFQAKVKYETNKKWSASLDYVLSMHGDNNVENLFNQFWTDGENNKWYNYYPYVKYIHANTDEQREAAYEEARDLWMHGSVTEYKNEICLQGHYNILDNLDITAQMIYTFIFNNKNTLDKFDQGIELALAVSYELF